MNAEEAVRLARLAVAAGLPNWVKLEIHPDPRYLLPDPIETFKAAEILVKEGFTVLPYINADPVLAKRLQDVGTATVMPLGSPIGSNRGIQTRDQIRIIIEQATVPVVVDAGLGAPSHAAEAMEMGADAVLVNTAIAVAERSRTAWPCAFKMAVEAGRAAFEIGLGRRRNRQRDQSVDGVPETLGPTHLPPDMLRVRELCTWFPIRSGWRGKITGHIKAVDEVSFHVENGSTVGLVGESGSGKSTVARAMLKLIAGRSAYHRRRHLRRPGNPRADAGAVSSAAQGHADGLPGSVWLAQPAHDDGLDHRRAARIHFRGQTGSDRRESWPPMLEQVGLPDGCL